MVMTDTLWRFWERLGEGGIDWDFLYCNSTNEREERDRAKGWVVERGFVNVYGTSKMPRVNSPNWKVICGRNMNPVFEGKRWYFSSERYAHGYLNYLSDTRKINRAADMVMC